MSNYPRVNPPHASNGVGSESTHTHMCVQVRGVSKKVHSIISCKGACKREGRIPLYLKIAVAKQKETQTFIRAIPQSGAFYCAFLFIQRKIRKKNLYFMILLN